MQLTRRFFVCLLLSLSLTNVTAKAQGYYDSLLQVAFGLSNQNEYARSQEVIEKVRGAFPDVLSVYILSTHNLLNQNKVDEAAGYITIGLQLDPTSYAMHVNAAYYFAAKNNVPSAKAYLTSSLKLFPSNYTMEEALQDMRSAGRNLKQPAVFNELATWYQQERRMVTQRYTTLHEINATLYEGVSRDPATVERKVQEYVKEFQALEWHEMVLAIYGQGAMVLRNNGYLSQGLQLAQAGYSYYYTNGYRNNAYLASLLLYQLMECYGVIGNYERAVQHVEELTTVATKCDLHVFDILGLLTASTAYYNMNKADEAKYMAGLTAQFAQKYGYGFALVSTYKTLFVNSFLEENFSVNDAIQLGETAQQMAFNYRFDDIGYSMFNQLAVAYLRLGTRQGQEKCFTTLGGLVKYYKAKQRYSEAAITLNNLGAIVYHQGQDLAWAAEVFEESIQLAEKDIGHLSFEDKLSFYQSQISAYSFLTASYAQLNKPEAAFRYMEGSRSRVLTERLAGGKKVSPASMRELQDMLLPDEACIMYSLFSGHEISILVVTKKGAQVVFHSDNSFIGDIKDKYLDRINKEHGERKGVESESASNDPDRRVQPSDFNKVTQLTRKFFERPGMADEILHEYLKGYYKFLILPVANRLTGIKKLLISPDDVLNFIPFEALMTYDGKYLVEKFDVQYVQSTGALKLLQQRNYPASRKSLLAMGGAVFEEMQTEASPLVTQKDKNQLQLEVSENHKTGGSQRKAYASVFGTKALTPLPGTVEEVKNIAAVVTGAEIYTGPQMTENKLKDMSASGQLSNFKILHLATHGFVVNDIPDLSGIAMSIFKKEQGEDGYLTVNELASLNLKADLTILSACQTALGKIYSGEGVTGLTQSLMIAGSNAALVSLWPVNDNSTMQFMSGLYKENVKGRPFVPVVNELKRKFIKGEFGAQYKHPNYWAPFVYYGR